MLSSRCYQIPLDLGSLPWVLETELEMAAKQDINTFVRQGTSPQAQAFCHKPEAITRGIHASHNASILLHSIDSSGL